MKKLSAATLIALAGSTLLGARIMPPAKNPFGFLRRAPRVRTETDYDRMRAAEGKRLRKQAKRLRDNAGE